MHPDTPAFPTDNEKQVGFDTYHYQGLTKREYFAAKFAAAIVSGLYANPDPKFLMHWKGNGVALEAYKLADTMFIGESK